MENSTYPSNVGFAAQWLSGFVGETPIFAMDAIRSKYLETMSQDFLNRSCQSVKGRENAQSEASMVETENNFAWGVESAEGRELKPKNNFDLIAM
jgi:hypothetical protein